MQAPQSFANYPKPEEGPKTELKIVPENNPELRGIPLVLGANLICRVPMLQKFFWTNAGFGKIKDMECLDHMSWRFQPDVIPLGKTGPMIEPSRELLQASSSRSGPTYYTVNDYHEMYKSGQATPLQVVEALLPLIKQGQTPQGLYENAWSDADGYIELALEAAKASTERWAKGKPIGILDGVPVGIKDDTDVKGLRNFIGMVYKPGLPTFDKKKESAWPVKKLQEAGAIVLGKNRMHELGSDTNGCNPYQGTPTNHHNNSYYPGASTSGGSSALSAGVVPIVVGTDAGGSCRTPACFNGIYGLKTTQHRTMTMKYTMCITAPLAATVSDLTIAYRVMSQPNPDCPIQGRFALSQPPAPGAKRVMGVYRDWWKMADPKVVEVCEKAMDWFVRERGYEIVDIEIPYLAESRMAHGIICIAEMAEEARRRTPNPADWLSIVNPANKILLSVGSQTPSADYIKCNGLRELLMRHMAYLYQKYPGLLVMTPTTGLAGWPIRPGEEVHGVSDTNKTMESMAYIFLSNITGTPSLTAPVGYVKPEQGEGDLPIGLMAMGEWGAEEQLLAWAGEAEEYVHDKLEGGRRRPKAWLDVMELVKNSRAS